jgi:hypothetical protein
MAELDDYFGLGRRRAGSGCLRFLLLAARRQGKGSGKGDFS